MTYLIYLDDTRDVPSSLLNKGIEEGKDVVLLRSLKEFVKCLSDRGIPDYITFDYYLSDIPYQTGMLGAQHFVRIVRKNGGFPVGFEYDSHSAYKEGADDIRAFLKSSIEEIGYVS